MRVTILLIISLLIGLGSGFFAGQEYTKNSIRAEFEKVLNTSTQTREEKTSHTNQVQEEQRELDEELKEMNKIKKGVGDETTLAMIKLRINSVKEETMIQTVIAR